MKVHIDNHERDSIVLGELRLLSKPRRCYFIA